MAMSHVYNETGDFQNVLRNFFSELPPTDEDCICSRLVFLWGAIGAWPAAKVDDKKNRMQVVSARRSPGAENV